MHRGRPTVEHVWGAIHSHLFIFIADVVTADVTPTDGGGGTIDAVATLAKECVTARQRYRLRCSIRQPAFGYRNAKAAIRKCHG